MCFITVFIYFILGLNYVYVLSFIICYVACHLVSQFFSTRILKHTTWWLIGVEWGCIDTVCGCGGDVGEGGCWGDGNVGTEMVSECSGSCLCHCRCRYVHFIVLSFWNQAHGTLYCILTIPHFSVLLHIIISSYLFIYIHFF